MNVETTLAKFMGETRNRLAAMERRLSSQQRVSGRRVGSGLASVYKVVAPIKPGEEGSGLKLTYSTKQVGSPLADEGWIQIAADNDSARPILDSEYQTLAMPGQFVRAIYDSGKLRTIGEFGITNVRVKAIADVAASTEGEYQIIDGGSQTYDGSPVTIKATLPKAVSTDDEFLFSYDRVAREWYEVETGSGGGTRWIIARPLEEVNHDTATFKACWAADLVGETPQTVKTGANLWQSTGNENDANAITVKNLDVGSVFRSDDPSLTYLDDGNEYVFALKRGMKFIALLCDDGQWQITQSGGVLEDYDWAAGGPSGGTQGL